MKNKKKHSLLNLAINLISIAPLIYRVSIFLTALVKSEADDAKRKIVLLIMFCIFFAALLVSTWLCLLAMLFLFLVSFQLSPLGSLTIVLIINVLVLVILGLLIYIYKNEKFFPQTREILFRSQFDDE